MFRLMFDTDGAAFDDGDGGLAEIDRILGVVRERLSEGRRYGFVSDINGNTIGSFEITEED